MKPGSVALMFHVKQKESGFCGKLPVAGGAAIQPH